MNRSPLAFEIFSEERLNLTALREMGSPPPPEPIGSVPIVKKWAARDAARERALLDNIQTLESDFTYVFVEEEGLPDPELGGVRFFEIDDDEPIR